MNSSIEQQALPRSIPRKLNCLIVVPSLIRAGAETQAVDLANGLAALGHTIHLCSFESQLDQRQRLSDAVQFHHLQRRSKYDLSLIRRLSALIDVEQIEVVQGVLQFATLVAWLAARKSNTKPPVVAAIHTTVNRGLKQELQDRLVYRRMLKKMAAIVFVCNHQQGHWIRKYPELERLSTVVHNGVAPERFRREELTGPAENLRTKLGIPTDAFVFSVIAAFRPEKGHRLLIEAFARVRGDAYLVFAGDGGLRAETEAYADTCGVLQRARFLGNIPDTRPLIAASNATVLASTAVETFSMAMLESMALGVPMIAPVIGGLPEAIADGKTGLLFPVGDVRMLSQLMQSTLDNQGRTKAMGRAAQVRVNKEFTLDKMIARSEEVLRTALSKQIR